MRRRRNCAFLGMMVGVVLCAAVAGAQAGGATPGPAATPRPNFIVINLDDTRYDGIDRMPTVQSRLVGEGISFSRSFVPNPVCCPSRASLLTGLYSIHHGTRTVAPPLGGATAFRTSSADRQTIAVWLHDAGYVTGLFGKYLNGYAGPEARAGANGFFYVPPGWDRWRAMVTPEGMGGKNGRTYFIADEHGRVSFYALHTDDSQYSTDVLAKWMREFVDDAVAQRRPFFAYFAPYASHGDPVVPAPAERHAKAFPDLPPWRPPSWRESDRSDKPRWVQALPPDTDPLFTDAVRLKAYQSLLAVDEAVAGLLAELDRLGVLDRTVIVLTSDNGAGWGEHGQFVQLKDCPYEECIRVPLVVRDPRATGTPRVSDAAVLNIDLAPTLAALAGVPVPVPVDGLRFDALLTQGPHPLLRSDFLLEHFHVQRFASVTYIEQVSDGDQIRLLLGDWRAPAHRGRLFEFDADGVVAPAAEPVRIGNTPHLSFFNLGARVVATLPDVAVDHLQDLNRLVVAERSSDESRAYWWTELDQAQVMQATGVPVIPPDYFGVRDVVRNYTYVEYATGEVELYDLDKDPWQLDNKASDPAYAVVRAELADRLAALLQEPK